MKKIFLLVFTLIICFSYNANSQDYHRLSNGEPYDIFYIIKPAYFQAYGTDFTKNYVDGFGSNFALEYQFQEIKVGVGVDAKLGKQLKLSFDVYDPNDVRVKLRTQYQLAPDTFLVGETDNLNKSSEKSTYIGVRQTF